MPTLQEYKQSETRKVLLVGDPKGSGKSTFAMSAPGKKLLLQYDLGSPTLPPGVDPNDVFVRVYPPTDTDMQVETDRWKRPKNVGSQVIQDVMNIHEGVTNGKPIEVGGETLPWVLQPGDTVIMDGLVQWDSIILDWILAVNRKTGPEDFDNGFALWGKRLNQQRIILDKILPLPLNLVLTTWAKPETRSKHVGGKVVETHTGKILPDLGGKLSVWGPGKVDSSIYLFSETDLKGRVTFFAQIKPTDAVSWVGIRNDYGKEGKLDITIKDGGRLPWQIVFDRKGVK